MLPCRAPICPQSGGAFPGGPFYKRFGARQVVCLCVLLCVHSDDHDLKHHLRPYALQERAPRDTREVGPSIRRPWGGSSDLLRTAVDRRFCGGLPALSGSCSASLRCTALGLTMLFLYRRSPVCCTAPLSNSLYSNYGHRLANPLSAITVYVCSVWGSVPPR